MVWPWLNPFSAQSKPTTPALQTSKWVPRDPSEWRGTPYGVRKTAKFKFPCIGAPCLAHRIWHEPGRIELALQAEKGIHRQSSAQWQHLCESCADAGEHQRWAPAAAGSSSSSGAAVAPAPVAADDFFMDDVHDSAIEAAVAEAEQMQDILNSGGRPAALSATEVESADRPFSATAGSRQVSLGGSNACSAPCTRIYPLPRPNPSTRRRMRADRVRDRFSRAGERDDG